MSKIVVLIIPHTPRKANYELSGKQVAWLTRGTSWIGGKPDGPGRGSLLSGEGSRLHTDGVTRFEQEVMGLLLLWMLMSLGPQSSLGVVERTGSLELGLSGLRHILGGVGVGVGSCSSADLLFTSSVGSVCSLSDSCL